MMVMELKVGKRLKIIHKKLVSDKKKIPKPKEPQKVEYILNIYLNQYRKNYQEQTITN